MKVLFFFSILHDLYARVADELRRSNVASEFAGIAYGIDQLHALKRSGFPVGEVVAFTEYLQRGLAERRDADECFLRRWESSHGLPLALMIGCDRRYKGLDRSTALRIAEICIDCVNTALNRTRPNVIVSGGINSLLSYVLYCEARRRNLPFFITYATPLPERLAIYGNPDNHWERVEALFTRYLQRRLTAKERTRADALREAYLQRMLTPSYVGSYQLKAWSPARLARDWRTVKLLLARLWYDREHELNPSYEGGLPTAAWRRMLRDSRRLVLRRYLNAHPRSGERYVLFPLQVQPEVSTSVFAPFCGDQVSVIEHISRSLPVDTWLYVKEHPVMMGRRALADYRRIRAVPNVRLLVPGLSTPRLIRDAVAVATITSTVGWEAVVHEKPVLVLGNVWYDRCGLVDKVEALAQLPAAMERALQFSPDRERLLRFIVAMLDGTYEGEIDNPQYRPGVLDSVNVQAIARAVVTHLEWYATEEPSRMAPLVPASDDANSASLR